MKKKQLSILLLVGMLALSMLLAHSLIASEKDDAVSIALQGKSVTLCSPFEIKSAMIYKDGGTIAIVIEDGMGSSLPFCLDGRIKRPSSIRHLYIGATHPSGPKPNKCLLAQQLRKLFSRCFNPQRSANPAHTHEKISWRLSERSLRIDNNPPT